MAFSRLMSDLVANVELFPLSWLLSESITNRISQATTGIALFEAVQHKVSPDSQVMHPGSTIVDFNYLLINPVLEAITRVTLDDCLSLPLSALIPEGVNTTLIRRMAEVVETGQAQHHTDVFHLDGVVAQHDQVYVKAGNGVLMIVMDVTYKPLLASEHQRRSDFIEAFKSGASIDIMRERLIALMI